MNIQSMFQRVLLESGQFLIDETEIELDVDKFSRLVKIALGAYNKHRPYRKHYTIDTGGNYYYTFIDSSTDLGIPQWVSDIVPIRILGTLPKLLLSSGAFQSLGGCCWGMSNMNSWLEVKQEFPWEYRKPILHVPIIGQYDCLLVFFHKLLEIPGELNVKDYEVPTIDDNDNTFFQLLTGKFMRALAMSRRAFTIQELPLTSDADTLASDGVTMEKEAMEDLESKSQLWYLAWH